MDRYTHTYRGQLSAALDVLPDLSQPAEKMIRATGTAGAVGSDCGNLLNRLSPSLSLGGGDKWRSVALCGDNANNTSVMASNVNHAISSGKEGFLTDKGASDTLNPSTRRGGRVVERAGLENQ